MLETIPDRRSRLHDGPSRRGDGAQSHPHQESHSREELTARKDGRATLIERAELQRWLAALPTIGRKPEQEPAHVAASLPLVGRVPVVGVGSARGRHGQAHARAPFN